MWPDLALLVGTTGFVATIAIALLVGGGGVLQALAPKPPSLGTLEAPRSGLTIATPVAPVASAPRAPAAQARAAVPVRGKFAVSFGRFTDRQRAEAQARRVRAKGYQASVVPAGTALLVVTRAYHDRPTAEFWSQVFKQVGLDAKVVALSEISSGPQRADAADAPRLLLIPRHGQA